MAMCDGARSLDEIKEKAGVCGECEGCEAELGGILTSVCGCNKVSLAAVVDSVKSGANTLEAVGEITGAGTACGRCKKLVANVIELGR